MKKTRLNQKNTFGRFLRRSLRLFVAFIVINLIIIIVSNYYISETTKERLYNSIDSIPKNDVGLLLGTSMYLARGVTNPFFEYRIDAAVQLYKSGKIRFIIVSGDNSNKYYNEPKNMRNELIKHGVPAEAIYLDYAGFRTLDSVVRCNKIFQQEKFTIISQEFHNQRAVYIAQAAGLNVVAYNAHDVALRISFKTLVRELLAKVKVLIDVHIIHTQPKFLGDEIPIGN